MGENYICATDAHVRNLCSLLLANSYKFTWDGRWVERSHMIYSSGMNHSHDKVEYRRQELMLYANTWKTGKIPTITTTTREQFSKWIYMYIYSGITSIFYFQRTKRPKELRSKKLANTAPRKKTTHQIPLQTPESHRAKRWEIALIVCSSIRRKSLYVSRVKEHTQQILALRFYKRCSFVVSSGGGLRQRISVSHFGAPKRRINFVGASDVALMRTIYLRACWGKRVCFRESAQLLSARKWYISQLLGCARWLIKPRFVDIETFLQKKKQTTELGI